jgi:hypothetical protein
VNVMTAFNKVNEAFDKCRSHEESSSSAFVNSSPFGTR